MPDAEPLDKFLARTARARPEDFVSGPNREAGSSWPSHPVPAAEFQRMKDFIRDRYQGVKPHSSFVDAGGVTIDFIPFAQQPSVRAARAAGIEVQKVAPLPPAPASAAPAPTPGKAEQPAATAPDRPSRKDGEPQAATVPATPRSACPPGYVPLARVTLEEIVRHGSLDGYLHKSAPSKAPPPRPNLKSGPKPGSAPAGPPPPG